MQTSGHRPSTPIRRVPLDRDVGGSRVAVTTFDSKRYLERCPGLRVLLKVRCNYVFGEGGPAGALAPAGRPLGS